jgi:hypothetical protein
MASLRSLLDHPPLFISTEIDEALPEGAEIPTSPQSSNQFQEFVAMSEEERIEAGSNNNRKNTIMPNMMTT